MKSTELRDLDDKGLREHLESHRQESALGADGRDYQTPRKRLPTHIPRLEPQYSLLSHDFASWYVYPLSIRYQTFRHLYSRFRFEFGLLLLAFTLSLDRELLW